MHGEARLPWRAILSAVLSAIAVPATAEAALAKVEAFGDGGLPKNVNFPLIYFEG